MCAIGLHRRDIRSIDYLFRYECMLLMMFSSCVSNGFFLSKSTLKPAAGLCHPPPNKSRAIAAQSTIFLSVHDILRVLRDPLIRSFSILKRTNSLGHLTLVAA